MSQQEEPRAPYDWSAHVGHLPPRWLIALVWRKYPEVAGRIADRDKKVTFDLPSEPSGSERR